MALNPYATVATSSAVYGVLLRSLIGNERSPSRIRLSIKAISALHSAVTAIIVLYALRPSRWTNEVALSTSSKAGQGNLDDSGNPVIRGRSSLANALTAWETGYLLYDTGALIYEIKQKRQLNSSSAALKSLAKSSPVLLAHHLLLAAALGYLQTYTAAGHERGVWVIVAFLLMNASNPVLHIRYWIRERRGRPSLIADALLMLAFAAFRFGTVGWVLKRYGDYHGLGPWQAFLRLRRSCQIGTAALVGVNGVWWLMLVKSIVRRALMDGRERNSMSNSI
ncbi:hypothetical protein H2201_005439 [Coniosporium apollinis]|uniref:TLC domain-containing protein n=1 Tax=Coniosporium apollinis TaxID=61459 RepID=A0ABQ9NQ20_9PEZI|nr:hypothetical protein H2201_005439 [Coniosporium apollinis]